jgi:hypothetical protein
MCFKCEYDDFKKISYREVPIKALIRLNELKDEIKSNGEKVTSSKWYMLPTGNIIAYVIFEYWDGHQIQSDAIQLNV